MFFSQIQYSFSNCRCKEEFFKAANQFSICFVENLPKSHSEHPCLLAKARMGVKNLGSEVILSFADQMLRYAQHDKYQGFYIAFSIVNMID